MSGDINLGDTLDTKFTTSVNGTPTVLTGTPIVAVYLDDDLTEITAGITLTIDFDGRVGFNNIRVVATVANGFAAAVNYSFVLTAGTVGGVAVAGTVVGQFSIERRNVFKTSVVMPENTQQVPPAEPTPLEALMYLFMALRNRGIFDANASFKEFANDAGTVIWKKAITDVGGVYTENKGQAGP